MLVQGCQGYISAMPLAKSPLLPLGSVPCAVTNTDDQAALQGKLPSYMASKKAVGPGYQNSSR